MAINYADKFSSKVDDKFTLSSVTEEAVNTEFDWLGVEAISVLTITTDALGDYNLAPNGIVRYGTPTDVANTKQVMTLTKDRSISKILDKKSMDDTNGIMTANAYMAKETDEQIIPEVDIYRIATAYAAAVANGGLSTVVTTKDNAYDQFMAGCEYFGDNKVPEGNRFAYVSYAFYGLLKKGGYIIASERAMANNVTGKVEDVEGVRIKRVPSSYLPTNCNFVMWHKSALVAAKKLEDYKVNTEPDNISGVLVNIRVRYDAFALAQKLKGFYAHSNVV